MRQQTHWCSVFSLPLSLDTWTLVPCPTEQLLPATQIHDEEVLRLLYEEAKGNVLAARYPCDVEDCEALGALVCRVQLGPFQPGQPTVCTLR